MEYQVRAYGVVQSAYVSLDDAIEFAVNCPADAWAQVIAHTASESHESWQVIWPVSGEPTSSR